MAGRVRSRLTFANVASSIALFLTLTTGIAYAHHLEVRSSDIVNGEVKTLDMANAAVTTAKLALGSVTNGRLQANSVTSGKVANNTLTGDDIDEDSLGNVPHAHTAGFAFEVDSDSVGASQLTENPKWRYIGDPGEPGFLNGWSNYDPAVAHNEATWQQAGFYRDNLGLVHLGGLVSDGTVGQAVFHLPDGYCPWFYRPFPVLANNALGRVTVTWMESGCDVIVDFGDNDWVSLDGISWRDGYEENSLSPAAFQREMERRRALGRANPSGPSGP